MFAQAGHCLKTNVCHVTNRSLFGMICEVLFYCLILTGRARTTAYCKALKSLTQRYFAQVNSGNTNYNHRNTD